MCAVQCSSEASSSSQGVNVNEATDSMLSQLSQLIADCHIDNDVINAFITVTTSLYLPQSISQIMLIYTVGQKNCTVLFLP